MTNTKSVPSVLYQTCSVSGYCAEQDVWGKLGVQGEKWTKQNKRELNFKENCVQWPEGYEGLSSLHQSSRATDRYLLNGDPPYTILSPSTF